MQAGVASAYAVTSPRVGDLAWLTRYHTHRELSLDIRLWEDEAGQLVGWTYARSFGGFNVFVPPGYRLGSVQTPAQMIGRVDDENAAGLFEPVGTHPAHQRRGLARAVCIDALHALRAADGVYRKDPA